MQRKTLRSLVLAILLGPSVFAADKIYMPFFELINVHSDYQYSTARLFKSYVDEQGKYEVVIPARGDSIAYQPAPDSVRALAKELGCAYYLVGDMNRIGETVILNLALYGSEDGKRIWGDKLKASGPDDLDPIFQKLARALGGKEKAAADGDIYSVTDYESRGLRQMRVRNSFGVAIGGLYFTPGLLYGKEWEDPFVGGFGVFWAYDARQLLFELDADFYSAAENSSLGVVSISAFKPIAAKALTPFFGGGLGIGMTETQYQSEMTAGSGLMVHGGGGIVFNRTSSVQLRMQARYVMGLFELGSPREDYPRTLMVRMELAFGR